MFYYRDVFQRCSVTSVLTVQLISAMVLNIAYSATYWSVVLLCLCLVLWLLVLYRGYYTVVRRYEYYFRVVRSRNFIRIFFNSPNDNNLISRGSSIELKYSRKIDKS